MQCKKSIIQNEDLHIRRRLKKKEKKTGCQENKSTVGGKKSLKIVFKKSKNNPSPQNPDHAVSVDTATATFQLFTEGIRLPGYGRTAPSIRNLVSSHEDISK